MMKNLTLAMLKDITSFWKSQTEKEKEILKLSLLNMIFCRWVIKKYIHLDDMISPRNITTSIYQNHIAVVILKRPVKFFFNCGKIGCRILLLPRNHGT